MKKKTLKILVVLPALFVLATIVDCGGSSPPATGFKVWGQHWYIGFDGQYHFLTGAPVQGQWLSDYSGATGSTTFFTAGTFGGYYHVVNGRAPARWLIYPQGACLLFLDATVRDVTIGSNQLVRCVIAFAFAPIASPSSIDLANPPPTITFSGGGFDTTYGMPVVEYYDEYSGTLMASTTAFSVAPDGSSLQIYTPGLYGAYTGSYNVMISNKAADGSNIGVGVTTFSACCIEPPPPEPPPDPPYCGPQMVCLEQ